MLGGGYLGDLYLGQTYDSALLTIYGVPAAVTMTGVISTPASALTIIAGSVDAVSFLGLLVVAGYYSAINPRRVNFNTSR